MPLLLDLLCVVVIKEGVAAAAQAVHVQLYMRFMYSSSFMLS